MSFGMGGMYIVQGRMLQSRIERREVGVGAREVETPCLIVDLDRLDRNIRRMAHAAAAAGVGLRPHAKTHKLAPVAERQVAAGCDGVTVAKLGEAEMLVDHGIDDLFIAYPLWGEAKWQRVCRLAEQAAIRVSVDSYEACEGLSAAAARRGLRVPARIEVDTGFGRCGVQSVDEARALARRLSKLRGIELVGLMSFAGHAYAVGPEHVRDAAVADAARVLEVAAALREDGFAVPEISVGSTPVASHVAELGGVTEIRPGAYVFSDRDQVVLGWGTLDDCALTVLATVVSRPTPTRAVIDAGTKTLTSDRAMSVEGWGAVRGQASWTLVSLYEEHGVLEVPPGEAPIGTTVEIIPNHACGAVNMHDWVAAVRDGAVEEWWRVEGRGLVR
jgi:D-serine deaminase-like pyridoxal phosphate-dependent protein